MGKKAKAKVLIAFGKRVRELRKAEGFSQESFAAECDLDRTYMGGVERGERNLGLENVEKIATALEITIEELLRGI
jgi:transcriptional regulator with XRE-family HTH domain